MCVSARDGRADRWAGAATETRDGAWATRSRWIRVDSRVIKIQEDALGSTRDGGVSGRERRSVEAARRRAPGGDENDGPRIHAAIRIATASTTPVMLTHTCVTRARKLSPRSPKSAGAPMTLHAA